MKDLNLKPVEGYTVHSSDSETRSSDKGFYSNYSVAFDAAKGSGWYGSNGEVKTLDNLYQDENGNIYSVKSVGMFTDLEKKFKEDKLSSIKSKLTKEELEFLKIN